MIHNDQFVNSFITYKDNSMKLCAKNLNILKRVCFSYSFRYSFLEMTSKIAILVFRSKLDVNKNKYTLILKSVN